MTAIISTHGDYNVKRLPGKGAPAEFGRSGQGFADAMVDLRQKRAIIIDGGSDDPKSSSAVADAMADGPKNCSLTSPGLVATLQHPFRYCRILTSGTAYSEHSISGSGLNCEVRAP